MQIKTKGSEIAPATPGLVCGSRWIPGACCTVCVNKLGKFRYGVRPCYTKGGERLRKTYQPLASIHVYTHACTHIDMHLYKHINHTDSTTQIHVPKNDLIIFQNMPLGCELEGNIGLGSFATYLINDLIFVKNQRQVPHKDSE